MGKNVLVCPWIKSRSECVLNVVSQMAKKFQFCPEEVGCNVVGECYGSYVMLICLWNVASSVRGVSEACVSYNCS